MKAVNYSICVYCGARDGLGQSHAEAAEALGAAIAEAGCRLVYGAGDIGLMGRVARAAQDAGGSTFGVIPQHLVGWEIAKHDLGALVVTETMHERKKVMVMNSDAIAVLPGGAGTLDEFFEVLTWRQLGLHAKPIVVINIDGYWDPLIALLDHVVANRFAGQDLRDGLSFVDTAEAALPALFKSLRA